MHGAPQDRSIEETLTPRSVAVIGASEDLTKFGGRILKSLIQHGFEGAIYPINPQRESLRGLACYPSVQRTPAPPDMAIMAVPPDAVRETVAACAEAGIKAAIIVTAKFSEAGDEGAAREREVVEVARRHGMRIIGPNCLGLISPVNNLALCASPALFVPELPPGEIGFVSQSGALMATVFDRAITRGIGFSHCFSIGNQADLELCDFVEFLVADPHTKVICSYLEGVKDATRFVATARRVHDAGKRWIIVKAGRSEAGAAAAFSHTASLAGSFEAFAAACRAAGVLVMDDTDAMTLLAALLGRFPETDPRSTAIVTTSGGSGAIAADRLTDGSVPLASFAPTTVTALQVHYPAELCTNPVDMGAAERGLLTGVVSDTVDIVLRDPATDIILTPVTTVPDIKLVAEHVVVGEQRAAEAGYVKPHILLLQPAQSGEAARGALKQAKALYTDNLDEAVRTIAAWQRLASLRRRAAPERPADLPAAPGIGRGGAIDEIAAKRLLDAYGVPVNRAELARDAQNAAACAERLRAPFAVKVISPDIVHKSDVGGVALDLDTASAVEEAVTGMAERIEARLPEARIEGYAVQEMAAGDLEMFVGARRDPQFGPILVVGAGGILVELLRDVAVACAPIDATAALELLNACAASRLLGGVRGRPPLDVAALADAISRVSWLVHDLGDRFEQLDVNPVLVSTDGCVAVDARLLLGTGSDDANGAEGASA